MNIGSVFLELLADGAKLTPSVQKAAGKAGDAGAATLRQRLMKGFVGGAGLGAGIASFNLVGRAISAVTDTIREATQAFIADEKSQVQLRTAIRANVDAWDGNTDAIEDVLAARMKLGFSDDEQRESLKGLVAAYGDVNEALDVQRTAMDLARFSGVDLATASATLIKVHAGNYRALKALGIQTKGITNETDALAAVQKVASGQAEDYAGTLEGRLTVATVKADEAMEHLGQTTAEFSADFEEAKAGAIENFVMGLDFLVDGLHAAEQPLERQIELLEIQRAGYREGSLIYNEITSAIDRLNGKLRADALGKHADALMDLPPALGDVEDATDDLTDAEKDSIAATKEFGDTLDRIKRIADKLPDALDDVTKALFGVAQSKGDLAEARKELADLLDEPPGAKAGTRAWTIYNGKVAEAKQKIFELQFEMKKTEGPEALDAWLRKQRDALGKSDDKARDYLNTLIAINSINLNPIGTKGTGKITAGRFAGKVVPLATGGHVDAGRPYFVGERGPELYVPDAGGTIVPNRAIAAGMTGTSGSGVTIAALNIDASGQRNPAATAAAVESAVEDGMARVLRNQSLRYAGSTRR